MILATPSPRAAARMLVLAVRSLGDRPGHEFHGNQWTGSGTLEDPYTLHSEEKRSRPHPVGMKATILAGPHAGRVGKVASVLHHPKARTSRATLRKIVDEQTNEDLGIHHESNVVRALGEYKGHPFHGNQYTDASPEDVATVVASTPLVSPDRPAGNLPNARAVSRSVEGASLGADLLPGSKVDIVDVNTLKATEHASMLPRTELVGKYRRGESVDPPAVNQRGEILDGHHRVASALAAGRTKMFVVKVKERAKNRGAGDYEGHPFHGNQWTEGHGIESAGDVFKVPADFKLEDAQYDVHTKYPRKAMVFADVDLKLLSSEYGKEYRVREMAETMAAGDKFPPLTLELKENGKLGILDGRTRVAALRELGVKGKVPAVVRLFDVGVEDKLPDGVKVDEKRTTSLRRTSRSAASKETALHAAADKHASKLSIVVRYAFARGRKALGRSANVDAAATAVKKALADLLPDALLEVQAAGGEAAVRMLRTAGDREGHPFHGNQWTEEHGERSVEEAKAQLKTLPKLGRSRNEVSIGERMSLDRQKEFNVALEKASSSGVTLEKDGESVQFTPKDIGKIQVSQTGVDKNKVAALIDEHHSWIGGPPKDSILAPIVVVRQGGHDVLIDGHHRLVAASLLGKSVTVKLLNIDKKLKGASEFRAAKDSSKPTLTMKFDASNPRAAKWAKEHAAELAQDISDVTREQIAAAIARQQETGFDSYEEILDAVGDEARAEVIARTESMRAVHAGQREAWNQAIDDGLLTGNERRAWIVVGDELTCPICSGLDGETAKLGGQYNGGYDSPPAHPNCRCTEGIV